MPQERDPIGNLIVNVERQTNVASAQAGGEVIQALADDYRANTKARNQTANLNRQGPRESVLQDIATDPDSYTQILPAAQAAMQGLPAHVQVAVNLHRDTTPNYNPNPSGAGAKAPSSSVDVSAPGVQNSSLFM